VSVITTGGGPAPEGETRPDAAPEDEDGGEEPPPDSAPQDGAAVPDEETARRLAYANVLEDALFNGALPDGTKLDWTDAESAAENEFAIADVDGDGEEELVLLWTNASMAGMQGIVFGYRDGDVYEELSEFPGFTFYGSGTVTVDWSHNQGWAGRFWPYTLYQYTPEMGDYVQIGAVDAWDRSLFEDDEALSAAFPQEADADGDGLVYYILTGEWYANSRTPSDGNLDGRLWGIDPVDGPAMEDWLNACTGGTEPVQLPLQKLTEENIAGLGYWSIPGPTQEAVG